MMSSRSRVQWLLPFILLFGGRGAGDDKAPEFMVRIRHLAFSKYNCTVLAQDGRLRREVTSFDRTRADVYEGMASEDDVKHLKELAGAADFQTASQQKYSGLTMLSPEGRMLVVEVNLGNRPQAVAFADATGKAAIPFYLAGFLSFADEVKGRNLPKIKGKVETMCRPLTRP
jgi:hypothetical protein